MLKRVLVYTIITLGCTLFFTTQVNASSILETKIDRTYTVSPDFVTVNLRKVTSVKANGYKVPKGEAETFIIQNFIKETPERDQQKLTDIIKTLVLTNENGQQIQPQITRDGDTIKVSATFPYDIRYGQSYSFNLSYHSTDLVAHSGNLYDIYVPAFAKDYPFTSNEDSEIFQTIVKVPVNLGPLNFAVPDTDIVRDGDFWQVNIPTEQLIGRFAWIQMGTQQFYEFNIKQDYTASTSNPFLYNTFEIVIPRDVQISQIKQQVYFKQFDPKPERIEQDDQGNLIAIFNIPANRSGSINITGYAQLDQTKEDIINKSGTLADIPADMLDKTAAAPYWEVDSPEIQKKAKELKGDETNIYKLVAKTYLDIVNTIDYANVDRFGIVPRHGALATLKGGSAVCMEYSDLFIALMRAEGVPARAAYGHGYDNRVPIADQVGHEWAEVYFPGLQKWVSVDVTWGESGQLLIGGDLNHFYTHIAEKNPDQPPQIRTKYYGDVPDSKLLKLIVNPLPSLPDTSQLLTAAAIQDKYRGNNWFSANLQHFQQLFGNIDYGLDTFLTNSLNVNGPDRGALKLGIYLLPVLIIGLYIVVRRLQHRARLIRK